MRSEKYKYIEAEKRVKKKKEFFEHFTTFLVMSVFFFLLNMVTSFGHWWFMWPIIGWGIGVFFHYMSVFGLPGIGPITNEWEKKAIQEEIEKIEAEENYSNAKYTEDTPEDKLELKDLEPEKEVRRKNWDESDLV